VGRGTTSIYLPLIYFSTKNHKPIVRLNQEWECHEELSMVSKPLKTWRYKMNQMNLKKSLKVGYKYIQSSNPTMEN
jgi:hypothetical protein